MTWADSVPQDTVTIGYRLSMDDMGNEDYNVIFDGYGQPSIQSFTYGPLEPGQTYNFILEVLYFYGASEPSDPVSVKMCKYLVAKLCFR